jgi:TPR repeat protein
MKRAVLVITLFLCLVGLISSLRILAVESTVPRSLILNKLRLFGVSQARYLSSYVRPEALNGWISDRNFVHQQYLACSRERNDANAGDDLLTMKQSWLHCIEILHDAVRQSPTDGRLWLELATTTADLEGVNNEVIEALRMSYVTAFREGWVAKSRQEFVTTIWPRLPPEVRKLALEVDLDAAQALALGNVSLSSASSEVVQGGLEQLEASARKDNLYALEKLGEVYLNGDGVPADATRAQLYLERAIEKGSVDAQIILGQALWKGDDLPVDKARGLRLIESAALTNPWAQEVLGNMLLSGELPRDVPRALALLESSAGSGNPYALEALGDIYLTGDGVPANPAKGQTYLERAVEKGNIGAQVKLGQALWKGDRLPIDREKGLQLIESAARTDPWGQLALGRMLLSGELPRDVPRALALLEASAEKNNPYALEELGVAYLRGDGVQADPDKARAYLEQAVEKGSAGAQVKLGEALWKGDQLGQDKVKALELLENAALTNSWGQLVLGRILLSDMHLRDVSRGLALLESSANKGNQHALETLARVYEKGDGVAPDPVKAQMYHMRVRGARQ